MAETEKDEKESEEKPESRPRASNESWLFAEGGRNFFWILAALFVAWVAKFIDEKQFLWAIIGLLSIQFGIMMFKRFSHKTPDVFEIKPIIPERDFPIFILKLANAGFKSVKIKRFSLDQKFGKGSSSSEIAHFFGSYFDDVRKPICFGVSRYDFNFSYIETDISRIENLYYTWFGNLKFPDQKTTQQIYKVKQVLVRPAKPEQEKKEGEEQEEEEET